MTRVQRFDRGGLGPPVKREDGSVLVDAYLCRTGIQVYRQKDGSEVREFRPREHVCSDAHLASMAQRAVTIGHPPAAVSPTNAREFMHGSTGESFEIDSIDGEDWVRGTLALLSDEAIAAVEGGARETSQGYTCEIDPTPGKWNRDTGEWGPDVVDGEPYDAVQTHHVANHSAILDAGRAWVDTTEEIMRLDGADAVAVKPPTPPALKPPTRPIPQKRGPVEVRADGDSMSKRAVPLLRQDAKGALVSFKKDLAVDEEAAAVIGECVSMLQALLQSKDEEMAEMGEKLEQAGEKEAEMQAALDAAKADAVKAKADAEKVKADAASPATRKARRELEQAALQVLGEDFKIDEHDDASLRAEVQKAQIAAVYPSISLDGKDASYITALADAASQQLKAGTRSVLDGLEEGPSFPRSSRSDDGLLSTDDLSTFQLAHPRA